MKIRLLFFQTHFYIFYPNIIQYIFRIIKRTHSQYILSPFNPYTRRRVQKPRKPLFDYISDVLFRRHHAAEMPKENRNLFRPYFWSEPENCRTVIIRTLAGHRLKCQSCPPTFSDIARAMPRMNKTLYQSGRVPKMEFLMERIYNVVLAGNRKEKFYTCCTCL